ncbi:MAG: hypothetical protein KAS72_15435 [Phycisphaerales bacterium]|nr:hypothetical protein [Phycisphaerales bacterium]
MPLTFVQHKKISLRKHPEFNEAWLHDRICEDPSILGLGDVRVIDRERVCTGGGRLDLLLFDEDNDRRYEVEVMLGATDPSHIIRTIEYWDIERRRYPGYDHVAVLIAEDVTARFLNVMSLLSGSIPLIAIQLDALHVGENILLNFVQVLDQTDMRVDDTDDDGGGGQTDRAYWDKKAGKPLMAICDQVLAMINEASKQPQEFNYLRGYIGLRSNGVVRNIMTLSPKRTKKFVHIGFHHPEAGSWHDRFEEAGVPSRKGRNGRRFRVSVTPEEFASHQDLIREAIVETVKEFES